MDDIRILRASNNKVILFNFTKKWKSNTYKKISQGPGYYRRTWDGEHYGFITIHNDVCPPKYRELPNVSELFFYGFARVSNDDGLWGLIDTSGFEMLSCEFDEIYIPAEYDGRVVVIGKKQLYGLFFPETGVCTQVEYSDFELKEKYIETTFEYFEEVVQSISKGKGLVLYDGTEIFSPDYANVSLFYDKEEMYIATRKDGKKEIFSRNWEKPVIADEFFQPTEGFIKARNGKLYAFINQETGKNITRYKYRQAGLFNRLGFATVTDGIFYKIIDTEGNEYVHFKRKPIE